ncbi:MAG: T9SS type A sorting domain-containing protein [Bacteroidetes bacterium]|nr:T9SS type A sorting domain-containing protein [Bacteroidota bacterium]
MKQTYIYTFILLTMFYTTTQIARANTTFTTQQIQQLQYVASLCPYTDGMAVYQARFLLAEFDSLVYENNCELDINGNGQRLAPEEERESTVSENTSIKIYPNPANEKVVVELPENTVAHISVYNSIGQLVMEKVTNSSLTSIDITTLPTGIYNIKARGDNIVFNTKLIIIK